MTSDQNKGITAITYNHLNLPVQVNKGASDYIVYTYDAGGRKLSQQVFGSTPKITDYMGEFIYEGNVLQFVNTEEGRIVMTGANPEYQYHLKDHLGNVRTTFTIVTTPEVNTATYEPANQSAELAKYLRLDKAKLVTAAIFDHTNGAASGASERLNGSANEKFGIARSISVTAGDVISTEVYAKYVDPNSANWNGALTSLIGQIATGTVGVVVDGANYSNAINPFPYPGALAHTPSGTGPKAYLNWLVFDKNWTLDLSKSGYMQMSTAGKEAGTDVAHERLFSPTINITEPGYVYVYLSNEETTPVDVYFDDLKVTQVKTPIVQTEDYYPFGLTFNAYQRDSSMPDQYLYNGKELQDELSLGWLDYGARMYMPELGRWGVVDPLTSKYEIVSPYNYAYNNPILFVDPTGRENTIYLMVAGKMRSTEVTRIINSANAFLNKLGLKTQVKLFEGKNFDTRNLDKTDNFAVIGYDRRAVAEKVRSITGDHFADHADRWASKDGDKYNPEVANGIINGMGIAVDHSSAGNIGTQDGNSNPDSAGGSAITLIHAGAHSSWVIQGKYGKVGKGDKEGHTAAGVAANGNKLVESFNRGGADEVLKQDNSAYIEAMMQRYGTKEAEDNYEKNRRARNK